LVSLYVVHFHAFFPYNVPLPLLLTTTLLSSFFKVCFALP
jgi:hypothetical protein